MSQPGAGATASRFAFFFDFDGTLVDIAERPDAVAPSPDLPALLGRLRERAGGALAIVTGRTVAVIDGFLGDPTLDVCGLHGLERRFDGTVSTPPGLADLGPEIERLRLRFADSEGVLVEDKRIGVALHWRLAPQHEAAAAGAMADLAARLGPAYKLQDGKAVRELLPTAAGKGAAIEAAMERPPYSGRTPLFMGDDRTDEDGFLVVNALGGISVKVGPGDTVATHRLAARADVPGCLAALASGIAPAEALPAA